MTTAQDKLSIDAAKAATLIKSTAESTATALNIQYIQKDILEIKEAVKGIITAQDGKIADLEKKIEAMQKTMYMGMGLITAFAFAIPILIRFLVK